MRLMSILAPRTPKLDVAQAPRRWRRDEGDLSISASRRGVWGCGVRSTQVTPRPLDISAPRQHPRRTPHQPGDSMPRRCLRLLLPRALLPCLPLPPCPRMLRPIPPRPPPQLCPRLSILCIRQHSHHIQMQPQWLLESRCPFRPPSFKHSRPPPCRRLRPTRTPRSEVRPAVFQA